MKRHFYKIFVKNDIIVNFLILVVQLQYVTWIITIIDVLVCN